MEFGHAGGCRPPYQRRSVLYSPAATSSAATAAPLFNESSCFFCGVDYESGRRLWTVRSAGHARNIQVTHSFNA